MQSIHVEKLRPARFLGPAILLAIAVTLGATTFPPRVRAQASGNHASLVAALADLRAAITEISNANNSFVTDRNYYHRASQRAINALEGVQGPEYRAEAGTPGDQLGALGHLDALLHQKGTPVWAAPLDGAEANMRGAVAHLLDANKARSMMRYALASSRALAYLEVARGRPDEVGVFGGLEGALANTELGVPEGAAIQDGCAVPTSAPSYGVHRGYLAWVAFPASEGVHTLAESAGERTVRVENGMILLPTAAAARVAADCQKHAAATPAAAPTKSAAVAPAIVKDPPPAANAVKDPPATNTVPALYTKAQAEAGAQVFATTCVSCHGADLQGTAAPGVAGTEFLTTAHKNGWTMEALRYLVVTDMPFNDPHSLSPKEYADLLAFVLASNCYPAGNTPFPTDDDPAFAKIPIAPVPGPHPHANKFGVCPVS